MHQLDKLLARVRGRLSPICITGTNGKTTTTGLIAAILFSDGQSTARIDGFGCWLDDSCVAAQPTQENAGRLIERADEEGVQRMIVEVTSSALVNRFACRWPPSVAVITNVSRDHDHVLEHPSFDDYVAAKYLLLQHLPREGAAILNGDDETTNTLASMVPSGASTLFFSTVNRQVRERHRKIDLSTRDIHVRETGTRVLLEPSPVAEALGGSLNLKLLGRPFAENALAAALVGYALGVSGETIKTALNGYSTRPGRFEVVAREPLVVVDYATSPHALKPTLQTARELAGKNGRVFCVFGCGGHPAHPSLRPRMGLTAGSLSDYVIITNDNPRWDAPTSIAADIEKGLKLVPAVLWTRCLDRREAIELALNMANPEDVVVIAGKGHEEGQTMKGSTIPFSDHLVVRELHPNRPS